MTKDHKGELWELQPHTEAKHIILKHYLGAWFAILGSRHEKILYVDGFAGPGAYSGGEPGSPIIAIQVASNQKRCVRGQVEFLFIENDRSYFAHLQDRLAEMEIADNFIIHRKLGEFRDVMAAFLDDPERANRPMPPSFAMIDPFGVKGVPFSLIGKILSNRRCEVLVNFMVDAVNRCVGVPNEITRSHVAELFGTDKVFEIIESSQNRVEDLQLFYQRQLRTVCKHILPFRMGDRNKRTLYYLLHCSNHIKAYDKMKEAMRRVETHGLFSFSDAPDRSQPLLFDPDHDEELARLLADHFKGKTITVNRIEEYIRTLDYYYSSDTRPALRFAEENGMIAVKNKKADGNPRVRGTFAPGVVVTFLESTT